MNELNSMKWVGLEFALCACVNASRVNWKMAAPSAVSGIKQAAKGREATRSSAHEPQAETLNMEDLRRLQIAHEGMRLLLSSEIKQAEQLFRKSR